MKRVAVEDGLQIMPNQFELAVLDAKSTHELIKDARPLIESGNLAIDLALRGRNLTVAAL